MADTLINIETTPDEWTDIYAATGIAVGTLIEVQNIGTSDVYLCTRATQPPRDFDGYNIIERGQFLRNEVGDSGAWALSVSAKGKINVRVV